MKNLLLIDGNSIMNRAFYGIMGNKMLMTNDGKYTNALYGFLAILFKNIEEIKPDYMLIAFDSKTGANVRKQIYDGYKKSRHGMPEELAEQMPEIKEILDAMNIKHMELADFEGDDILGTMAKKFASDEINAYILSGDRDLFQLVQNNIIVRIPRTKAGKTETEVYDESKIKAEYGLKPTELIELKALMGDSSDEIPGAKGVGPKTATTLLQKYKTIDGIYEALQDEANKDFKPKLRENLIESKDLVYLSKELGAIRLDANVSEDINEYEVKEWNKEEVVRLFKYYKFNRYLSRFGLDTETEAKAEETTYNEDEINELLNNIVTDKKIEDIEIGEKLIYYIETEENKESTQIIKKDITGIGIYDEKNNKIIYVKNPKRESLKALFENEKTEKIGCNLSKDYVLLRQNGIKLKNIKYDIEVAAYDINPSNIKHKIEEIAMQYLELDIAKYIPEKQITLFETGSNNNEIGIYVYAIKKLYEVTLAKLKEEGTIKLFNEIEIPLITVLGEMQYTGMLVDKEELTQFGVQLKKRLEELTTDIYKLADEEFNINSTQQLGNILFEKLKLPAPKKTKTGYSTDVDTLEKLKSEHDIIPAILEYRTLMKLNSTYVEGLISCINEETKKIHSYFHQTITATGRISSTEPNLQNIPTHDELGKNIKKAFKPQKGYVYIDADYSQIELRVLAHIANDENMIRAFKNDEDIHREVASKVFNIPFEEVTKEQRSKAKAVNFGIVYGITGFGLANQLNIGRKEAENYINSYLEKYSGIHSFMENITETAKKQGYIETLFGRRRYVPELKSNNYMVREFGKRVAMNTPIQGTAADIMKIAMNNVYKKLKEANIDAKIVLQVHDELIVEAKIEDKEEAKKILKECMENAYTLNIPLKVDMEEANSWYEAK